MFLRAVLAAMFLTAAQALIRLISLTLMFLLLLRLMRMATELRFAKQASLLRLLTRKSPTKRSS